MTVRRAASQPAESTMVNHDTDDDTQFTAATVAIGLLLGLLVVALLLGVWYVTAPPKSGLQWGGQVYTSEDEFKAYLRAKGLSYGTWVSRHPGAAPWDP